MINEMSFLFEFNDIYISKDNKKNLYQSFDKNFKYDNHIISFKNNNNNNSIKSYLNKTTYNKSTSSYKNLVRTLESDPRISISSSDLAYLEDIGVYPINRMIVLRRYDEGVIVPNNLNDMVENTKPISTVIGWITPDDEDMFSISFNEEWESEKKMFWDVIADIVYENTNIKLNKSVPVPGLTQGFLFDILAKNTKLINEKEGGGTDLPVGDPDYLMESPTRSVDSQGISSSFTIALNTSYVQKYIGNIDPGDAMMMIKSNLIRMGISDMKFIFDGPDGKGLMEDANHGTDGFLKTWVDRIMNVAKDYISSVGCSMVPEACDFINTIKDKANDIIDDGEFNGSNKPNNDENKKDNEQETEQEKDAEKKSMFNTFMDGLNKSVRRYRWKLRGSIGLMTGLSTTPWHLTIGNPLNPILSIGNVLIDKSNKISLGNEIGFNDMPTKISASYSISFGRPLGRQELMEIMNVSYIREYNSINKKENDVKETTDPAIKNHQV